MTNQRNYELQYAYPTWPDEESGVTIGIGWDCGYNSYEDLVTQWPGLSDVILASFKKVMGVKGTICRGLALNLKNERIRFTWQQATDCFDNFTIPIEYKRTSDWLPNFEKLPGMCKGALVSLVYNRGTNDDRNIASRREMANIKDLMIAENFAGIPEQIRCMKRLWKNRGLIDRRETESRMFIDGLK